MDNLDTYLHSDRQSSNFLTLEIQSNVNLRRNGSYASKIDRMHVIINMAALSLS